jgi:hypothetical protein
MSIVFFPVYYYLPGYGTNMYEIMHELVKLQNHKLNFMKINDFDVL